jgi:hypothetical protein
MLPSRSLSPPATVNRRSGSRSRQRNPDTRSPAYLNAKSHGHADLDHLFHQLGGLGSSGRCCGAAEAATDNAAAAAAAELAMDSASDRSETSL